MTVSNVANDAQYKWPAIAQLLGIVLQYLQDTLELALTHVKVSDSTQLLQRRQQPNLSCAHVVKANSAISQYNTIQYEICAKKWTEQSIDLI